MGKLTEVERTQSMAMHKNVILMGMCLMTASVLAAHPGKVGRGPAHPQHAVHHRHVAPPRHHHPAGARHWARPACPPPRRGALRAWAWVTAAWNMTVNGVYYYGDGYYYDGYNYYYNGAYYTTPPVVVATPVQPAPVVVQPAPVVVQPAPVVVKPAPVVVPPPPPPPPPRRRGLFGLLFGD